MDPTKNKFACKICQNLFGSRYSLTRHFARLHQTSGTFSCNKCDKEFTQKDRFVTHLKTHGIAYKRKNYVCKECNKKFGEKQNLIRHRRIHKIQNRSYNIFSPDIFICNECSKPFTRKDNLAKHIQCHSAVPVLVECPTCHQQFTAESRLQRHIRNEHGVTFGENKVYLCNDCSTKFSSKNAIKRHIIDMHSTIKERKSTSRRETCLNCVECHQTFRNRQLVIDHYQKAHNIEQEFEYLTFASTEDFEAWLSPCYVIECTWTTSTDVYVRRYRCHRSGIYQDSCAKKNSERKRQLKLGGSKKLQGYCPSEVTFRKRISDGAHIAAIQKTHVGHDVNDSQEIRHTFLTRAERTKIASLLSEGVPKKTIIDTYNQVCSSDRVNYRVNCLSVKDIRNIAKSKELTPLPGLLNASFVEELIAASAKEDDYSRVDDFVSKWSDSILFYKKRGECDKNAKMFDEEDFILIFQNKVQKGLLQSHGHKIVAFDGTASVSPHDLTVYTLLVLNTENEGLPVAFLISSRSDEAVMDVFVHCIRENAGQINTRTIMSDMENTFSNAWQSIMGLTHFSLYCMWHVRRRWEEQLNKLIAFDVDNEKLTTETRNQIIADVKQQLFDLADELNKMVFAGKLESFLAISEPAVQPFIDYFCKNFVNMSNIDQWATCYRLKAGLNVSLRVESFHRTTKFKTANDKNVGSIADCLKLLEEYIKYSSKDFFDRKYRSKTVSKLRTLKKRHEVADKFVENHLLTVEYDSDDRFWQLSSLSESGDKIVETHIIQKNKMLECTKNTDGCELCCELCQICFHKYQCSCRDCSVSNNMCKHIHALCLFLKNRDDLPSENEAEAEMSEIIRDTFDDEEPDNEFIQQDFIELDESEALEHVQESITQTFQSMAEHFKSRINETNYQKWFNLEPVIVSYFMSQWESMFKSEETVD